jgi:predicted  nucleic acid-binding Zn-ribbon protein
VRTKRDALVAVETSLGDLDREVRRQETEIDQVRAREDRDRKMLADGNVNSKQLTDLEHELATLQRRQGVLEDDLLELMERREAVDGNTNHARVELEKSQSALADAQGRRDSALADIDSTEAKRVAERAIMIKQFPADLLGLYERVRAQSGIGAGLLRGRRCGACRIEIDRTTMSTIKTSAADEVATCDECGAILVRTAESGL